MLNSPSLSRADAQQATSLVCKPRQTYRTAGLILGLPILLAGYLIYHIGTNGDDSPLTTDLVVFIVGFMLLCCMVPGYLIAVTGLSTVVVESDGIRRYGVWGGDVTLSWQTVKAVTLQHNRAMLIKGAGWTKIAVTAPTHQNFDQAAKLVQQAAVEHDIDVRVMSDE